MAASKSLGIIAIAGIFVASHASSWSGPIHGDIDGTGLGGTNVYNLNQCKARCQAMPTCRAAQYSEWEKYNGYNCYTYDNQDVNNPQLKAFILYKYTPHHTCSMGTWSTPERRDIMGIGLGGTREMNLEQCKARCAADSRCRAAQFSLKHDWAGQNCYIYDNHNDNQDQLEDFLLYKYTPNPDCDGSWSGPIYGDIWGVGIGGGAGKVLSLKECKQKCEAEPTCKAAQFSKSEYYKGSNCFIYDNQGINMPRFRTFTLFKYNPTGCMRSTWGCCPDNVTPKAHILDNCMACGSLWGCCPDSVTPKVSIADACVPCKDAHFGCCPDGKVPKNSWWDTCQYSRLDSKEAGEVSSTSIGSAALLPIAAVLSLMFLAAFAWRRRQQRSAAVFLMVDEETEMDNLQ